MKVLKSGNRGSIEIECTSEGNSGAGCGALLLVDRSDMHYYEGGGYMCHDTAVSIRCPECGSLTDIPPSLWPTNYEQLKRFTSAWKETGIDPE